MGLYEKAKKHMYEKKIDILDNLHKRNFRHVFKEDEKSIAAILKECRHLIKKSEESDKYISNFISALSQDDILNLDKQQLEESFVSILKDVIDVEAVLLYNFDGQKYSLSKQSQKSLEWSLDIVHIDSVDNIEIVSEKGGEENKSNIIEIDFLSILEKNNIENPENISSLYLKSISVLDKDYKCVSLFVFTSKNKNFYQEYNVDLLKMFSYIFCVFYSNSKEAEDNKETEHGVILNNKASLFKYIQNKIDNDEDVFINTLKLKHLKIPKKLENKYIEIYTNIDLLLGKMDVKNIVDIGSHNYIVVSTNDEEAKSVASTFKKTKAMLKKEVINGINFYINSMKFPDKKFNRSFDFISALSFLLDTGKMPKIKKTAPKKSSAIKKTVPKKTRVSKKKAVSKKTTAKKLASKENIEQGTTEKNN